MKTLLSAANPALKQLARLIRQRRARQTQGQMVLEGVHLAQAFVDAGQSPQTLYVPQPRLAQPEVAALLALLPAERVQVVAGEALARISSLADADDIISVLPLPANCPPPVSGDCMVLERVQDPGNVGTMLRNALAAGVRQVVLGRDCADVYSPKVLRAGMGAHARLALTVDADLTAWRTAYRDAVYATALAEHSTSLYAADLRAPAAWLFGNEGSGLSPALQQTADRCLIIPMAAGTESLNVAMASGICLFEQRRQRLATAWPGM